MLLKTLFFNLYTLLSNFSFYLFLTLLTISHLFLNANIRKKFITFLAVILTLSVWGFIFDLDGIFLVFLTTELTVFLLLLMTYLQLYNNFTFTIARARPYWAGLIIICIYLVNPSQACFTFISFYKSLNHFVSSDFYILYYFLFEKLPILVIFFTLIISFFSLFFILMYFNLKLNKLREQRNLKTLYFLRKQVLVKQVKFASKLYTFQN